MWDYKSECGQKWSEKFLGVWNGVYMAWNSDGELQMEFEYIIFAQISWAYFITFTYILETS